MSHEIRDRMRISEEAALWVQRLEHDDSPELRRRFDEWLRQGTAQAEELLRAQEIWRSLDQLDRSFHLGTPPRDAETLVELTPHAAHGLAEGLASKRERSGARWLAVAATVILAFAAALYFGYPLLSASSYVTAVGRQESVQLADGSVMHLNTRSRAQVYYTDHVRRIRLLEGEALFSVARDPARPFVVEADDVRIEALGTQFNVYRSESHGTRVSVIEGAVQVTPGAGSAAAAPVGSQLKAGEELEITADRVIRPQTADVQRVVAWRERRLMFDQARIDDIAREFNRYNRVAIRVEGEALRARRMGGTFDADDPQPLIRYLSKEPDVEVVRSDREILIRPKSAQNPRDAMSQ